MFRTTGAALLFGLVLSAGCSHQIQPFASPPITQDEAVALIMNLPECKAWAAAIEELSGGEVHAGYVPLGEWKEPTLDCWEIWRIEDHPDHIVRNQIFLVDKATRAIFVIDEMAPEGQELIPLAQWHQEWPQ